MLHTERSFSIYNREDEFEEARENGDSGDGKLERGATIGESIEDEFSFGKNVMCKIEEGDNEQDVEERKRNLSRIEDLKIDVEGESVSHLIYHDTGAGIECIGTDGGIEPSNFDDGDYPENYYERMTREDPSNPLFLRNYAQVLQVRFFPFSCLLPCFGIYINISCRQFCYLTNNLTSSQLEFGAKFA